MIVLLDRPDGSGAGGATSNLWREQLKVLAPVYRVIPIPLPRSFRRGDSDSIRNVADIVEETLRRRHVRSYGLAACGEDGGVAIELAARANARVRFLVLVDVVPRVSEAPAGPADGSEPSGVGPELLDPIESLHMPVLVFYRADLLGGLPVAGFMDATGYDHVDRIRVRRIASDDPILRTAADSVNRKLAAFLKDVAAGKAIVPERRVNLPSGLSYVDQNAGEGAVPRVGQTLTARMRLRLKDGTDVTPCGGFALRRKFRFDDTLIAGLYEGLSTMHVGGKRKLLVPAKLAYRGKGDGHEIPPGAALTIDVVLLDATDDTLPPAPSWSPKSERAVADGVRVVDRKPGSGRAVTPESIVTFEYKLWNASGMLMRATAPGRPKRGVLRDINAEARIWLPGMIGMKAGGERLIIGDATVAFGDKTLPGICAGEDVVFRVKLLKVQPLGARPVLTSVREEQYIEINPDLKYYDIELGRGKSPGPDSAIVVHYAFWPDKHKDNPDSLLDSSRMRRQPYVTPLRLCPPSWRACLPSMRVGGKRQMKLRYDGIERAGVEEGDWVIYEVELLDVLTPEQYERWRTGPAGRFPWEDR